MKVRDPKQIRKLMVIQGVTYRELAEAAWGEGSTHSYLGQILRGKVKSIRTEPAVRIAKYLGVGIDDLFLAETTSEPAQKKQRRSAA